MKTRQALFVSGIDGFCHRYAVLHRAKHLRSCGWEVSILPYRHPDLDRMASQADLLLLYRVPANRQVLRVLDRAIAAGVGRIGLVDDLIFRSEGEFVPTFVAGLEQRALWQEGADRYASVLALCDEVLASSPELVAEVEQLGVASYLYRDALTAEELALGQAARAAAAEEPSRKDFSVGYFSGTATHAGDFARAAGGLAAAMRANARISLRVLGPLIMPPELAKFSARISHGPLISWAELPARIAAVDLNLAPIDTQSRFSVAKGATKVMEAAACGVASIGSPTSSHRAAIASGGGWLADTEEEWRHCILEAATGQSDIASAGARAFQHITDDYGANSRTDDMQKLLARVAARARPEASRARRVPHGIASTALDEPLWEGALAPDAFPTLAERLLIDVSPSLDEHDILQQKFVLTGPGLFRLDLFTLTYGQTFDHTIAARLIGPAGEVCEQGSWDAARLPNHGFLAWTFERPLSTGSFILEVEAVGTGPGNAASFGLVQAGRERSLATINGTAIGGALGLRGFSAWDQVH